MEQKFKTLALEMAKPVFIIRSLFTSQLSPLDNQISIFFFGDFTYQSCSGTILGCNDYGWKSGTPIE
jgi:hypothetical protein